MSDKYWKRICKDAFIKTMIVSTVFVIVLFIILSTVSSGCVYAEKNTSEQTTEIATTTTENATFTETTEKVEETIKEESKVPETSEIEFSTEVSTELSTECVNNYTYYSIYGHELDRDLSEYLQDKLSYYEIEWWYPYAICQAFQESNFDINCLTPFDGGADSGLYQLRSTYFSYYLTEAGFTGTEDAMNPYIQIDIYCFYTAQRINKGQSIEKTISDWTTGGADRICEVYVNDVLQWFNYLEEE